MQNNEHNRPRSSKEKIPFRERPTCSVQEACEATGLGRSTLYEKMNAGEIKWTKVNTRRLIIVRSLLRMLGAE